MDDDSGGGQDSYWVVERKEDINSLIFKIGVICTFLLSVHHTLYD